jgi:hypothetical protein
MSILGDAVRAELSGKGVEIDPGRVEQILVDAGISTSATMGVPVRLQVHRVYAAGTKLLKNDSKNLAVESLSTTIDGNGGKTTLVPFYLDWSPTDGVNGVGSERNLRGKSSVLHFMAWGLTGRCPLQADVLTWIKRVEVEFGIDDAAMVVAFDVNSGVPTGSVTQRAVKGVTRQISLGTFSSDSEFESLMGALMLERLRLEPIAMWSNNQETSHAWPAYASALAVHADHLDPVVGNEGVLGTRMLQMFVGTPWAPVRAQAATALSAMTFARERSNAKTKATAQAAEGAIAVAEARVTAAQKQVNSFGATGPDVDAMLSLAAAATDRMSEAQEISLRLFAARSTAKQVHDQLRAEELRRNAAIEDALARRFFNAMTPTVCPRCSAAVSQERREGEGHHHECSLCTSPLDLNAFAGNILVASDVSADARHELIIATAEAEAERVTADIGILEEEAEEYGDHVVDALDALQQAAHDADAVVLRLETEFVAAERNRLDAVVVAQASRDELASARDRREAELALARAQGALEGLRQTLVPVTPDPADDARIKVLKVADRITAAWLKNDQDPLLREVSNEIAELARRFGADNITSVSLKGNANMDVYKGGAKSGYGRLTNGEKLRIKLATAVALIIHGRKAGVGRHPGLLFIDSPAAEEIPASDLKTMLDVMRAAADETSMQVVVATRHTQLLTSMLPEGSVLAATGDNFVW